MDNLDINVDFMQDDKQCFFLFMLLVNLWQYVLKRTYMFLKSEFKMHHFDAQIVKKEKDFAC